jgi:hypothetical protein
MHRDYRNWNPIDEEEFFSSKDFKFVKRYMKRELPWLLDIVRERKRAWNSRQDVGLLFVIDPYLFSEMYDVRLHGYIISNILKNESESNSLSIIFDMDFERARKIDEEMDAMMNRVRDNVPDEISILKQNNRYLNVTYYLCPNNDVLPCPPIDQLNLDIANYQNPPFMIMYLEDLRNEANKIS